MSLSLVFSGAPNDGRKVNGGIDGVMGGRPCGVIGICPWYIGDIGWYIGETRAGDIW